MELTVDQAVNMIREEEAKLADVNEKINQSIALINELRIARATLADLPEKETETLIPIGGGILLPGKTSREVKVMLNVGAGAVVERDITGAISFLDNKIKQVDENIRYLSDIAAKLDKNVRILKEKVNSVIRQRQGPTVVG